MLKFMVIVEYVHEASAFFFDEYNKALQFAQDAECGLGAVWQLYTWDNSFHCYMYLQ